MNKRENVEAPNDSSSADSGAGAAHGSTSAQGEGAASAGLGGGADAVTEPGGLEPRSRHEPALPAVRCSAIVRPRSLRRFVIVSGDWRDEFTEKELIDGYLSWRANLSANPNKVSRSPRESLGGCNSHSAVES